MNTSGYRLTDAPRHASMQAFDCALCGHPELGRPVFLATPDGNTIAAGSGCAAAAIYGRKDSRLARRVAADADAIAFRAAQAAEMAAERMGRYGRAADEFAAHLDGEPSADLTSTRQTYFATVRGAWGGEHRMTFPAFLAEVAASGEIPG
jgi:hypothetical protein